MLLYTVKNKPNGSRRNRSGGPHWPEKVVPFLTETDTAPARCVFNRVHGVLLNRVLPVSALRKKLGDPTTLARYDYTRTSPSPAMGMLRTGISWEMRIIRFLRTTRGHPLAGAEPEAPVSTPGPHLLPSEMCQY